jgi:hypothetical protein
MSCICQQPVRPEFKSSYKDLLDKPRINSVTLSGDLTAADLGIKAGAQFKIVSRLPDVEDVDVNTVYLVAVSVGGNDNIYQEWIYIDNNWEKIGDPINVGGVKASVRWDGLTGTCRDGMGDTINLFDTDAAQQFFGVQFDQNTAYLSLVSEWFDRGVVIVNDSSSAVTLRYFNTEGFSPTDIVINPRFKAVLKGTLFFAENTLVVSGEFVQKPMPY